MISNNAGMEDSKVVTIKATAGNARIVLRGRKTLNVLKDLVPGEDENTESRLIY